MKSDFSVLIGELERFLRHGSWRLRGTRGSKSWIALLAVVLLLGICHLVLFVG